MDILEFTAFKAPIRAAIEIPGSKSYTNRALVMAALTKGPVTLYNLLYSDDTHAMIECLRTLGIRIETFPDHATVYDDISVVKDGSYEMFVHDSGTTLRFLLALLCLTPGTKTIKGNVRLNERPIKDLVEALRQLGAKIDYLEKENQAPLKVHPSDLCSGGEVSINTTMSSQFVSALLIIAPILNGLNIRLQGEIISKPYVEMTIQMMDDWGVEVLQSKNGCYQTYCRQHYKKKQYVVEGDFSSAGYFFAIAALTKSTITLQNLNPHSLQADRKFLNILTEMGNETNMGDREITMTGKQVIPLSINMEDCPDQVQTMAVLAAFANGVTTISGVRSLRLKETERVVALKKELMKMGIRTEDTHDTLTIFGGNPHAAVIDTYNDHRMAMAFAIAGTKLPDLKIRNPEVVNKTFPNFWDKLKDCL